MSPDKHIRKAAAEAIATATGVFVTDQVVPISESTPDIYVLLHTQGRTRMAVSKQNHEWLGTITISLVKINEKGYISSVDLDDLDTQVVRVMDSIKVPGFRVGFSRFFSSDTDNVESPANTVNRKHIIYEIWVNKVL